MKRQLFRGKSIIKKLITSIFTAIILCAVTLTISSCSDKINTSRNRNNNTSISPSENYTNVANDAKTPTYTNEYDKVFSMFSDDLYKCDMTDCTFSNGFSCKIPSGITSTDADNNGVYMKTFVLENTNNNCIAADISYGPSANIERNICDYFVSIGWIEKDDSIENMKKSFLEEAEYINNNDPSDNRYNIDVIDAYLVEEFDTVLGNMNKIIDIMNSDDGELKTYDSKDDYMQVNGYNDGQILTIEALYNGISDDSVSVCIIKRIDEGAYSKLFIGAADSIFLTDENKTALAKLEYTAKKFGI